MTHSDKAPTAEQLAEPYICAGCGSPFDEGYSTCKCVTGVGFLRSKPNDTIVAKPCCDWCGSKGVSHNLDGDALCLPCCTKWARGEGIASMENIDDQ